MLQSHYPGRGQRTANDREMMVMPCRGQNVGLVLLRVSKLK